MSAPERYLDVKIWGCRSWGGTYAHTSQNADVSLHRYEQDLLPPRSIAIFKPPVLIVEYAILPKSYGMDGTQRSSPDPV
jgi:hypothetical protein